MTTRTLYRPVGLAELHLIFDLDMRRFPPRLDWQPIFYPVLNFEYAAQIARDWNTKDAASGYVGYVTAFDMDETYLAQFEVQTVGASNHQELWIPAGELAEFNKHIDGTIRVEAAFYGDHYDAGSLLNDLDTSDHLTAQIIEQNAAMIYANWKYWHSNQTSGLKSDLLQEIKALWDYTFPLDY